MEIVKLNAKSFTSIVKKTIKCLKEGGVVVCPTDTVYGLLAIATNKKAVDRVFQIKKRAQRKPIPIFIRDLKQAKELAEIGTVQEYLLKTTWPGKVTFVFWRKRWKKLYGINKKSIALRIPDYPLVNQVLKKINLPLTGTSANIAGRKPATKTEEVLSQFKNQPCKPDFVVDAGNLKPSKPSKVIDLTSKKPKILRE